MAVPASAPSKGLRAALHGHWPEYLIEAFALAVFMLVAAVATTLMEAPGYGLRLALPDAFVRRVCIGAAMAVTAVALIYSPWGKRSGAHMNPAITPAFYRLGKIEPWDAVFYIVAQFAGGVAGVELARTFLGSAFTSPPVSSIATVPGPAGPAVAFVGETTIAFIMMLTVLEASNNAKLREWTGVLCGALIFFFVVFESPLSGFGMNPARTFASALPSGIWSAAWIYFVAPILGMQLAVDAYRLQAGSDRVACAKLSHRLYDLGCIFRCKHRLAWLDRHSGPHAASDKGPVRRGRN